MIARQIGEGTGGDAHAVEPVLVEAVRGGLEREMRDAFARELVEHAMQLDRIGRGQRAIDVGLVRDDADGAHAGGVQPERRPDLAREGGNRGLARGAGDGGDHSGLAGEERGGGKRQRAAHVRHDDHCDAGGHLGGALGHDRGGAVRERLRQEGEPVRLGARYGDEQEPSPHPAAVRSDARQFDTRKARVEAGIRQRQVGEFHQACSEPMRSSPRKRGPK